MKQKDIGSVVAGLVALALIVLSFYGWVNNILQLADATGVTGMVVLRVIGVFVAPLGVVLGYV